MSVTSNEYSTDPSLFDADLYLSDAFERSQSALRSILTAHFHSNRHAWNIVTLVRQRIATSQRDSIVCDLCILSAEAAAERVVRSAPMICIDLITEESLASVQRRADDYLKIGATHVWLIDAVARSVWRATAAGLFVVREDQVMISGTSIGFRLTTVFQELDEMMQPRRRMSVSEAIERSRVRQTGNVSAAKEKTFTT